MPTQGVGLWPFLLKDCEVVVIQPRIKQNKSILQNTIYPKEQAKKAKAHA